MEARKLDNKVHWADLRVWRASPRRWDILANLLLFCTNPNISQDFFGKSDPYLEFYKQTATGWQLAHRTEVKTLIGQNRLYLYPIGEHLW